MQKTSSPLVGEKGHLDKRPRVIETPNKGLIQGEGDTTRYRGGITTRVARGPKPYHATHIYTLHTPDQEVTGTPKNRADPNLEYFMSYATQISKYHEAPTNTHVLTCIAAKCPRIDMHYLSVQAPRVKMLFTPKFGRPGIGPVLYIRAIRLPGAVRHLNTELVHVLEPCS